MTTPSKSAVTRELARRELARRKMLGFVRFINADYDAQWFHEVICDHLQRFAAGTIKRLMITMPPQHGKSELSTRSLPPFLFGLNPNERIAVLSYSASKARKFNREIQQRMASPEYARLFPAVRLATAKDEGVTRTMEEFDVVGHRGNLKSVGRRGPLTGDPVDTAILDDLIKDQMEAQSLTIREQAWDWIETVVETRLHNDSKVLYTTTRWDEDDPAGRFLTRDGYYSTTNPNGWVVLNFPALKTPDLAQYDHRLTGAALWPDRHSQERMQTIKKNNPIIFNALYQGDPKPSEEAVVYNDWLEIDEFPGYVDAEFYGIDFGYSNDPTAITRIGRIGRSLYLDELCYETGLTNQDILDYAQAAGVSTTLESICDKAEPKSIEELKRGYWKDPQTFVPGLNASGCDKGPGSIDAGILKLKEYTVYVTRRSLNIIKERKNYKWIMSQGKATNKPIDDYNHALDGIRSAVFTKYGKPQITGTARARSIPARQPRLG